MNAKKTIHLFLLLVMLGCETSKTEFQPNKFLTQKEQEDLVVWFFHNPNHPRWMRKDDTPREDILRIYKLWYYYENEKGKYFMIAEDRNPFFKNTCHCHGGYIKATETDTVSQVVFQIEGAYPRDRNKFLSAFNEMMQNLK
jgi:hypothetical protein